MSNLSEGQLHCSPIQVQSERSLQEICTQIEQFGYKGGIPTRGWGNVDDATAFLGSFDAQRPEVSHPSIFDATDLLPARLKARYYWDQVDVKAAKLLGDSADPGRIYFLNAVDLVLGETDEEGVYEGVLTTRSQPELKSYVDRAVRDLLKAIDVKAQVRLDVVELAIPSDFYLWLLRRYDDDQDLTEELTLELIRSLNSEDLLARGTSLTSGAQMDRAELAATVIGAPNKFGPARFSLLDKGLKLSAELELHPDGSYQVIIGSSDYDERLSRLIKGHRLVDDLTFAVLPKLRDAYSRDSVWRASGRRDLMTRAVAVLTAHVDEALKLLEHSETSTTEL